MVRPRWHDVVIALSLVALAVAGTAALWGPEIARWLGAEQAPAPAEPPSGPSGDML